MIITFVITVAITTLFFAFNKKRELTVGKLIYHNELKTKESLLVIEEVRFKNSIECIRNYNNLVFHFSNSENIYEIDGWTYNRSNILNGFIEIFRFGNNIKLIKTINKNCTQQGIKAIAVRVQTQTVYAFK